MKKILIWLLLLNGVMYADEQGMYEKCRGYHGIDGKTKALGKSFPLESLSRKEISQYLKEYKAGIRNKHGLGMLMKGQIASFSDEEIDILAEYISGYVVEFNPDKIRKKIEHSNMSFEVIYPKYIKKDRSFLIRLKLTNKSKYSGSGGITISLPTFNALNGYVDKTNFNAVTLYEPPKKMYNKEAQKLKKIELLAIEGWEKKWLKGNSKYITLALYVPKDSDIDTINFQVRAVFIIKNNKKREELLFPMKGTVKDQQGYDALDVKLIVND